MYIYGRKSRRVAAEPHRLQAAMLREDFLFLLGAKCRLPARARRGLFISPFTRGALSLRLCVSAWVFTSALTWESRKCVIWVDFILYTSSSTNPGESACGHTESLTHRASVGVLLFRTENFIVKGWSSRAVKIAKGQSWKTSAEWWRCWNVYTK